MPATAYILRLADVMLIVFFGFIAISNMSDTDVDLPESAEAEPAAMDTTAVVFIGVLPEGTFLIENEQVTVDSIAAVREYLGKERRRRGSESLKVRIRGSRDVAVRHVFEVAMLCDELGLPRSLEVKLRSSE